MLRNGLICLFCFSFLSLLTGQRPDLNTIRNGGSPIPRDSIAAKNKSKLPDTTIYDYFTVDNIYVTSTFSDTTLNQYFHEYDPVNRRKDNYLNLGNNGSANTPLKFSRDYKKGLDVGRHEYDIYNYKLEKFRYYKLNRPISDLFFSNVGSQQNFIVKSDFARNFSDGISVSLNYQRFNQAGFYQSQTTKTTNFGFGLWYVHPNKKYNAFVTLLSNVNEEDHNGGIENDTFLRSDLNLRISIPVNLEDATTRYQEKDYSLIQYYSLSSPDSSDWNFYLRNDIILNRSYYKFSDVTVNTSKDTLIYGPLIVDNRGIRYFTRANKFANNFYINGKNKNGFDARLGLEYAHYSITEEPESYGVNEIFLAFKGVVPFYKGILLNTSAHLGFFDSAGDFDVTGDIDLSLSEWVNLKGGLSFYRHQNSMLEKRLYISEQLIWENDFSKVLGSEFYGHLIIPKAKLKVGIRQTVENNTIYWNEMAQPVQHDGIFNTTQIEVSQRVRVKKFHLENYLLFQLFNENVHQLPKYFTKHNLYFEGLLFNQNMLARIGVETRIIPEYNGRAFQPATGQFYNSGNVLPLYPMTDFYFIAKISKFRAFLKMENITDYISDKVQYQVERYPQFDVRFRLGIRWLLLD